MRSDCVRSEHRGSRGSICAALWRLHKGLPDRDQKSGCGHLVLNRKGLQQAFVVRDLTVPFTRSVSHTGDQKQHADFRVLQKVQRIIEAVVSDPVGQRR